METNTNEIENKENKTLKHMKNKIKRNMKHNWTTYEKYENDETTWKHKNAISTKQNIINKMGKHTRNMETN